MFDHDRRTFLRKTAFGASALMTASGLFADVLTQTPAQGEGPFYPNKLPLDTDNDLLVINDSITPAVGEITHLGGRLTDVNGNPLRNAVVEIWQVDNNGVYIHSESGGRDQRDGNFQGFGRFMTGSTGEYYFRTIKPVPYPGRPPHIHFKVKRKGRSDFTTQLYVKGSAGIERDGLFRRANRAMAHQLIVDFQPLKDSRLGELSARFDIVLGTTPSDG